MPPRSRTSPEGKIHNFLATILTEPLENKINSYFKALPISLTLRMHVYNFFGSCEAGFLVCLVVPYIANLVLSLSLSVLIIKFIMHV